MDYKYYERKINDVILKCPIEAGVEILVYNVLDSILDTEKLSLVDINRLWKNRDERLTTDSGVSDMAILSDDFRYRTDIGEVYGFIEVKATSKSLSETIQVEGQKREVHHYLYTNGLVWKYYKDGKIVWEKSLGFLKGVECKKIADFQHISIDENIFNELIDNLTRINWIRDTNPSHLER